MTGKTGLILLIVIPGFPPLHAAPDGDLTRAINYADLAGARKALAAGGRFMIGYGYISDNDMGVEVGLAGLYTWAFSLPVETKSFLGGVEVVGNFKLLRVQMGLYGYIESRPRLVLGISGGVRI